MAMTRTRPLATRRGLYAITDGPRPDLLERASAALRGGAVLLQYRDKTPDHTRRHTEAVALTALCDRHGAACIVNDDVALARASGAHGVHLGESDGSLVLARATLGAHAIIGVSCYNDLERARFLAAQGVDYLAFGAFFPSPTKPQARHASPGLLRAARAFDLPLVAIGGITPDNGATLIEAGADFLSVVSGVFAAKDSEAAARRYSDLFKSTDSPA